MQPQRDYLLARNIACWYSTRALLLRRGPDSTVFIPRFPDLQTRPLVNSHSETPFRLLRDFSYTTFPDLPCCHLELQSRSLACLFSSHLLDGGLDVLVAGGLLQPAGEVHDGNVSGGHSEAHAGQLAVELGDNLTAHKKSRVYDGTKVSNKSEKRSQ